MKELNPSEALFRPGTAQEGRPLLEPPSAHELRTLVNGRVSTQGGEKNGIVDRALNAAPCWKLGVVEPVSSYTQQAHIRNNTNLGVYDVVCHDVQGTTRVLSEARVTEAKLLNKESIVAEQVGSILCAHERGNGIGLGIVVVVRLWVNLI